jgi:hypothetical protein
VDQRHHHSHILWRAARNNVQASRIVTLATSEEGSQ